MKSKKKNEEKKREIKFPQMTLGMKKFSKIIFPLLRRLKRHIFILSLINSNEVKRKQKKKINFFRSVFSSKMTLVHQNYTSKNS